MSPLRNLFSEFQKSVYKTVSRELFGEKFSKLSFDGNRHGMIEMLMELPEVNNLVIEKYFNVKDDKLAEDLYRQVVSPCTAIEEKQKSILLIKAFFASTYGSKLFFTILMELAETWFKLRKFFKSLQSCKYFKHLEITYSHFQYYEEFRVEFLLLESECYKKINLNEKSKLCVNEAMKSVNDFIEKKCGIKEDIFKIEKNNFLKPIFERLHVMTKWIEANPIDEDFNNLIRKDVKIPSVEGKPNEKLKVCSDAISIGYNEAKGRFLFATRKIKPGSVLIVDKPFASSTDEEALERNCLNCHTSLKLDENIRIPCSNCQTVSFCSETCRNDSWEKYHKYECSFFNHFFNSESKKRSYLLLTYRTTILKAIDKSNSIDCEFLRYHSLDDKSKDFIKINTEFYEPLDYKTVYSLKTHCVQINPKENLLLALRSIFLTKLLEFVLKDIDPEISIDKTQMTLLAVATFRHMQAIGCNAYEIVENVRNEVSKIWEPRNIGGAIYTSVSLSNHSCYPNVVRHSYPGGVVIVTSLRPIEKEEEILDCYGAHFLKDDKKTRQESLMKKYYFLCTCEACTFDWKTPLSDEVQFKCSCLTLQLTNNSQKCLKCFNKANWKKIHRRLEENKKKRLTAISKMYDGNYSEALPILLDYSNFIEKILSNPNLEAIKTQQSIIQCLNSMACTSIE